MMGPDETRACHAVDCCKILWDNADPLLKERWPLKKTLDKQAYNLLEFSNKSWILGIPGDPNKIRSEHPSIVAFDEAAFMPMGEEAYNTAIATRTPKMIVFSSAFPGWLNDMYQQAKPTDWPGYPEIRE
jgi:hypothetical protein